MRENIIMLHENPNDVGYYPLTLASSTCTVSLLASLDVTAPLARFVPATRDPALEDERTFSVKYHGRQLLSTLCLRSETIRRATCSFASFEEACRRNIVRTRR